MLRQGTQRVPCFPAAGARKPRESSGQHTSLGPLLALRTAGRHRHVQHALGGCVWRRWRAVQVPRIGYGVLRCRQRWACTGALAAKQHTRCHRCWEHAAAACMRWAPTLLPGVPCPQPARPATAAWRETRRAPLARVTCSAAPACAALPEVCSQTGCSAAAVAQKCAVQNADPPAACTPLLPCSLFVCDAGLHPKWREEAADVQGEPAVVVRLLPLLLPHAAHSGCGPWPQPMR